MLIVLLLEIHGDASKFESIEILNCLLRLFCTLVNLTEPCIRGWFQIQFLNNRKLFESANEAGSCIRSFLDSKFDIKPRIQNSVQS